MLCHLKKFLLLCLQVSWSKLISLLKSNTETAQTSFAKRYAVTLSSSSARKISKWSFVPAIALALASSLPCQCQDLKPEITPESHKVLSLMKTERVWKPRKFHLTEKHWFYKVEGKDEPVMLLRKIKGVRSDIRHSIDWHALINTTCTLLVTGLQCYQSARGSN